MSRWSWSDVYPVTIAVALCLFLLPITVEASPLSVAKQYVGMHERHNTKALKAVLGVNPARVKWCGAFVGAMVRKTGRKPPSGYLKASNWRNYGTRVPLKAARPGDIVVMRSHVTIYTRRTKGKVCGIGGNQSNRVKESCYSQRKVIGVRR